MRTNSNVHTKYVRPDMRVTEPLIDRKADYSLDQFGHKRRVIVIETDKPIDEIIIKVKPRMRGCIYD